MGKIIAIAKKRRSWKDNNLNKSSRFLRSFRKKVLLIDADPQANASSGLGIDVDNVEIGTYQILEHSNTPAEAIINVQLNVDIIPSHIDLVAIEIELVDKENREYMLKKALESIKDSMTLSSSIVHHLGLLTLNALTSRFSHHSYSV
jgi:chromosome partitioning protein